MCENTTGHFQQGEGFSKISLTATIYSLFSNVVLLADGECHVSNITVVTDTTEADNVTSISIEHDNSLFYSQEHDNKVVLLDDFFFKLMFLILGNGC